MIGYLEGVLDDAQNRFFSRVAQEHWADVGQYSRVKKNSRIILDEVPRLRNRTNRVAARKYVEQMLGN